MSDPKTTIRQAKADMTIRTSVLEARFLLGDNKLFDYFVENHLAAHVLAGLDVPFPHFGWNFTVGSHALAPVCP